MGESLCRGEERPECVRSKSDWISYCAVQQGQSVGGRSSSSISPTHEDCISPFWRCNHCTHSAHPASNR